ncbi:carbohydrate kinase family protein [Anaerolentibacter hominis]|uniref:carbohydrate kinase family protein n=1 Tax=Anaerolentibacter hominis TaxID=3079009 RepID=UPI0031B8179B
MYKDLDVLCVGGITSDVMMKPMDPSIFEVDKSILSTLDYHVGGDASNQSIVFSRLGNVTGIATAPGDDDTGASVRKMLEDAGVDTSNCVVIPGSRTRTSFVLIHGDGERNLVSYQAGMGELSREHLDLEQLKHTKMVSIGSIFTFQGLDEYLPEYLAEAKKQGVITCADTMSNMRGVKIEELAGAFASLDYFLPSYVEALDLTGEEDVDKMTDVFLSYGIKNVIIKLGTDGCLIRNANERYHIPIFPAECVDSTGAGDNFVAGFLTGVLKGWNLEKCGTFASAVGSIAIRGVGANTCVKNIEQVYQVMREAGRYTE